LWDQVRRLRSARLAHRDLRLAHVGIDAFGRAWLRGFGAAQAAADDHALDLDVARLLVETASEIGVEEATAAAIALGPAALTAAAPLLQRLALPSPSPSIAAWRERGRLLGDLRDAIASATATEVATPSQLTRIKPRTVWSLAAVGLAVYLVLPQVGHFSATIDAVSRANWWWLILSLLPAAATYLAAAIAQMGAVGRALPLRQMVAVQVACSFANRVTPAGTGGLGLNERYLERRGIGRSTAIGAVSVNALAGALVHFVGTMLALGFLGSAGIGGVPVPPAWWFLVGSLAALVVLGAITLLRPVRERVFRPVVRAAGEMVRCVRQPRQALELFGGSAGVTAGNALALAAALHCFGVHAPLDRVILVYLGGSAVASVSPTPGSLGAVEAALLAGLVGTGVAAGPALAGVLAFRLVTFWLPTVPGVWAFHLVQRRRWV
jgi:undecaprenyl-diphosphatase